MPRIYKGKTKNTERGAYTHGHTTTASGSNRRSPTYGSWLSMLARCYKSKTNGYEEYGGSGIRVCERWHTFSNFLADMGPRPDGRTLGRKDHTKDYSRDNCEWQTRKVQQRERRGNNLITFNGRTQCLSAWAEGLGMTYAALKARLNNPDRWPLERALTTPQIPNDAPKSRRKRGA